MARKSSKTAHVMNLLAGGEAESSKSEAAKENLAASQAAESKGTIKELTVLAQQASIQMQEGPLSPSPISIIDLSSSVQDPVAELIRQQLEEDEKGENPKVEPNLEDEPATVSGDLPETDPFFKLPESLTEMENESGNTDETDTEESSAMDLSEDIVETEEQIAEKIPETDEHIPTSQPITDEDTVDNKTEAIQSDTQNSDAPVQSHIQHDQDTMKPDIQGTPSSSAAPAPSNFKFLNVMEHVVENIAKEYMERLGGCTCEHCIADVIALTLTKLPPKYVVVEPPAASPLLNFYSSRFSPQVIVEVTKSCFTIKENPHH